MISRHGLRPFRLTYFLRCPYSSATGWPLLKKLSNAHLETFRKEAFTPHEPALLPSKHFLNLPAVRKWFLSSPNDAPGMTLNRHYLDQFGTTILPLEFTKLSSNGNTTFHRTDAPFQIFLQWTRLVTTVTADRLYLAQASLSSLPRAFADDLPTPDLVLMAGTGDIYDANIWMGVAPTYTPLHRDPNPNLFVQLAGRKVIRILEPEAGDKIFARVQSILGKSESAAFRGESMMKGEEKILLEAEVWDGAFQSQGREAVYEAYVEAGDGLFIPQGWWHSVKGIDTGITASVNWWFR